MRGGDNARVGELRGRPDVPPEEPAPAAPDRAPGPPSNSNNDARAIRDAFRRAEDPAFANPRVETRYVTDRDPDTGPAGIHPYRTSKDRPEPEPEPERSDAPTARTLEVETPRADNPFERASVDNPFAGDAVDKNKFNDGRKRIWEHVEDASDAVHGMGDELDKLLGRQQPTGQYMRAGPRESINTHLSPSQGIDGGTLAAAMLATGLAVGELSRLAYRKTSELRERRNAGAGNR